MHQMMKEYYVSFVIENFDKKHIIVMLFIDKINLK